MIILPLLIYFVLTFVYIIISFYLTDFIIRHFLGWEYSVDNEKNMQCMMEEVLLTGCLYRSSIIDSTKRVVRCGK